MQKNIKTKTPYKKEGDDESWSVKEYREIKRKAFIILSLLILTLFITAGILHSLSGMDIGFALGKDDKLTFDQALYYVTVTCSSVGYGDIVPNNDFSRIFILFLIITIIFIATKTTSDFNSLMQVLIYLFSFSYPIDLNQPMDLSLLIFPKNTSEY